LTLDSKVVFDTGSTGLLLPRNNCTTCGNHDKFNPKKSSTFSPLPGDVFDPLFGTGGDTVPFSTPEGANCTVVTDTVSIGPLESTQQPYIICDASVQALANQPADGIFGLGTTTNFSLSATLSVKSIFWDFYNTG
jgi:hypothetical protein